MKKLEIYKYEKGEEIMNVITHGVGTLLGVAGLVVLVVFSSLQGDPWKILSSALFGASMVMLYSASTIYHASQKPSWRRFFNLLDHISIFYLIAGSYTPFLLVTLRGPWGWALFGVVWGCTLLGTILKAILKTQLGKFSLLLYLAMGWCIVIALHPLIHNIELTGLLLTLAGGIAYSVGVIFYRWDRLPFNHAIWHLWVLAGTILQYFAILFYVILPKGV